MNSSDSFRATIYFGLAYIALVALAAWTWRNNAALLMIILTVGMAYVTQALATTGAVLDDNAHTFDAAGQDLSLARAVRFNRAASFFWLATLLVGIVAGLMLLVS